MKKVVVASLLAFSAATGMVCGANVAFAQTQVNLGAQPAAGGVQMSPAEYKDYNDAIAVTDPKAKTAAIEAYLTKYPQSSVKTDMLQTLMQTYSTFDPVKTIDAADRLLQVDPNNIIALTLETYFRKSSADAITDPAGKQAALDAAAGFAQKGLSVPKPAAVSDADFAKMKESANPIFYSGIATAALNKKDTATAIDNFKKELASVPVEQTKAPGPLLQDTYLLATAYYQSTPPDLVNCTFYASRAANFAPEPFKTQMLPLAKYCYRKYHGADDGLDAVGPIAAANLNPPADFAIKPAKKASDIVTDVISSTPDLGTLAISDKEFIMQNGTAEQAAKVWDTIKGKSVQIPDAVVISITDKVLTAAVSDDAVQSKTADFTFNLTDAPKTAPTVGAKIAISGTYASFTPTPIMITMSDSEIIEPKKAPVKAPVRKPAPGRAAPRK